MTIVPIATTVAGEEPDSAANSIHAKTPAMANPPGRCPTQAIENRMIRCATPPVVMNDDANITLAAPIDTGNRDWLFSALNDILEARDRGDAEDIPAEMSELRPDRQGLKA